MLRMLWSVKEIDAPTYDLNIVEGEPQRRGRLRRLCLFFLKQVREIVDKVLIPDDVNIGFLQPYLFYDNAALED